MLNVFFRRFAPKKLNLSQKSALKKHWPRPTLTCGADLTGSGAIQADSLTATTAGGATVNLTGAITTDTGALSITSATTMTLGATATGQTTVTLNAGGSDQGSLISKKDFVV